eukprot:COSAG01_NODE_1291_length_10881_cov_33.377017_3_plen_143_part_00
MLTGVGMTSAESAPVESLPGEPEPETHPTLTVTADSAPPSRDYKYEFIDVPGHNEAGDLGEAAATAQQLLVHECHIIVWVVKVGSMNESIFESTRKMLATCMETHQCNEFKFPTITVALTHVRIQSFTYGPSPKHFIGMGVN